MLGRSELDGAIEEYRKLVRNVPQLGGVLVELLIARNQRLLPRDRDWSEIESLIKAAKEQSPQSSEWVIFQAGLLFAQGKADDAQKVVDEARRKNPSRAELWLKSAELLMLQRRFAEARSLLDNVPASVNPVHLRLDRARLLVAEGSPELASSLAALADNSASFPANDRRRLLEELAQALTQLKDFSRAKKLWLEVADLAPKDLGPQLKLIELAFEAKNEEDINHQLDEIKRIEGADGINGRYCAIRYKIWQAGNAADSSQQELLCKTARQWIDDLASVRPDWSTQIHLARAQVDEVELERLDLAADKRKEKQYEAAIHYRTAIERGQRNSAVIRRVTELLHLSGHSTEIAQLWNQLGNGGGAGLDLQRLVTAEVLRNHEYDLAVELARKAKAADPKDYVKRLQLVMILMQNQHRDEAEIELRDAVKAAPGEDERWSFLIDLLVSGGAFQKAEEAIRNAEQALKNQSPLGLARCYEKLALGYRAIGRNLQKSNDWYQKAEDCYRSAMSNRPDDSEINSEFIVFLKNAGRDEKAESQLTEMIKKAGTGDPKIEKEASWARRTLASLLVQVGSDYVRRQRALKLVEPIAIAAETQEKSKGSPVPADDLRVLAEVYEAQQTPAYHKKAREVLEKLVARDGGIPEIRFRLAMIYSRDGDWAEAQKEYRALLAQTENANNRAFANRRPDYMAKFALELLQRHDSDQDKQSLNEAKELIDKVKGLRPDSLIADELQAHFYKASNQVDKAVDLIRSKAEQPNLPDPMLWDLARLAEAIDQVDLAQELLRKLVARSDKVPYRLALVELLGRRGKVKDALDLCEELWQKANPDELVPSVLKVFASPAGKRDEAQKSRAAAWFESALKQHPESPNLVFGLGSLREQQQRYHDAEDVYRRGVGQKSESYAVLNNLAWLMTLRKENGQEALALINRAIAVRGPDPDLLDTRGCIYRVTGDSQHAIEDLTESIALAPTESKYFHLAQAYLEADKKQDAIKALATARTLKLAEDLLHPLEVPAYHQVLIDLGMR
jgi:tetratricopeptide (TPR) repeat protein